MSELLTRSRWAVAAMFAIHGAVSGSFAARLPWIREHLDLSPGQLGLALIMPAVGSLSCMPFAGRIVAKVGGRTATRILISAWCLALVIIPLAPNRFALMGILLVAGATAGTSDIAMNTEGVAVEQRMGKSIMSGLHGMWSVGGLVGSGIGVGAAYLGIGAPAHFAAVSVVLVPTALIVGRWLLPDEVTPKEEGPTFSLPRGPVLIIGLIGFCAIFAEGATADWCAVYLREVLQANEGLAAVAYACFAFAMAAGRLAGDAVVRRVGAVRTVRAAGSAGVIGGVLVVLAVNSALTIGGFALLGIGVAVIVPLAFSAAGHTSDRPAHAIAGVATVSYGAGLAAPGLMGGIAHVTSLPSAFVLVTCLTAIIVLSAGRLRAAEMREPAVSFRDSA